jgi:hypothetical protein
MIESCILAGRIKAEHPTDEARDHRSQHPKQHRDEYSARIASGHDHFGQRTDHQSNN